MIKVQISRQALTKAKMRHRKAGDQFNGASIPGGKGRFYGFLGEEIVKDYLGYDSILEEETKDYDFIFDKIKVDVKTKTRKDIPKPWFDATVDKSSDHQKPDVYVFCQIIAPRSLIKKSEDFILNYNFTDAYILGYLYRDDFYNKSRFFKQGSMDPSNGIKYRDSIYLVKIDELDTFIHS